MFGASRPHAPLPGCDNRSRRAIALKVITVKSDLFDITRRPSSMQGQVGVETRRYSTIPWHKVERYIPAYTVYVAASTCAGRCAWGLRRCSGLGLQITTHVRKNHHQKVSDPYRMTTVFRNCHPHPLYALDAFSIPLKQTFLGRMVRGAFGLVTYRQQVTVVLGR